MSTQTIPEFFAKKNILITGATGLVGKVLVEKLLRSCFDIENIYVIMKSKRGKDAQSRVKDLVNLPLFDVIRAQRPGFENKIIALNGDVSKLCLGLAEEDYEMLTEKINMVFHAAATVQFTEHLYHSLKINTRGTREIINLCLKMKSLQVLMYVSTAYSNCNKVKIEEIMYPPLVDWKDAIEIMEKLDPAVINTLQEKYVADFPNPYILSKHLAEHLVWDNRHRLPVAIFRPTIIIGSWQEPFPGWVDTPYGLTGFMLAQNVGLIRSAYVDPEIVADYVPVDIVVKNLIVAVWQRAADSSKRESNIIYNCASVIPPVTMQQISDIGFSISNRYPSDKMAWIPGNVKNTKSKTTFQICSVIQHLIPALLVDTFMKIAGHKPQLVKLQCKLYKSCLCLSYFTLRSWNFKTENYNSLSKQILAEDKENFYSDLSSFDVETSATDLFLGSRKYILHDYSEDSARAKKKLSRLYWGEKLIQTAIVGSVLWLINLPAWVKYLETAVNSYWLTVALGSTRSLDTPLV